MHELGRTNPVHLILEKKNSDEYMIERLGLSV
jgi:hypothetical protein